MYFQNVISIQVEDVSYAFDDSDACYMNAVESFKSNFDSEWKIILQRNHAMKNIHIFHYDGGYIFFHA